MAAVIVLVINPDAFLKDKFNTSFTDTVTEMHGFGRGAGCSRNRLLHPTKISVIRISAPLLHHGLIGQVTKMLQNEQTAHQTCRLARTTIILTIQRRESFIEFIPICFVGQLIKRVRSVRHVAQTAEQGRCVIGMFYHKNLQVPYRKDKKYCGFVN